MGTPAPPRGPGRNRANDSALIEAERIRRSIAEVQKRRDDSVLGLIAEGDGKARLIRDTARRCRVCGTGVISYGRDVHHACENPMIGSMCICRKTDDDRPCTDRVWGDQGVCDSGCVPCRSMRGHPYSLGAKRTKK